MTNTPDTWDDLAQEVLAEVDRQFEMWGEQNHPDGTALADDEKLADMVKQLNAEFVRTGNLTWRDILWEEVREAFAEEDREPLREELLQVAAVALSWVNALDRRTQ